MPYKPYKPFDFKKYNKRKQDTKVVRDERIRELIGQGMSKEKAIRQTDAEIRSGKYDSKNTTQTVKDVYGKDVPDWTKYRGSKDND